MENDILDLNLNSDFDFFKDCRLALIKADVPHYKLVNEINNAFNFNLKREPKLDIVIYTETSQIDLENTISSDFLSTPLHIIEDRYFPLHRYVYPHSSIEMYIISNHVNDAILIADLADINYYFIIKHAENLTFDEDILTLLAKVNGVNQVQEIDISTFEYKSYLQFE